MDTIPEDLVPLNGPTGVGAGSGPGMLADARNKLAVALRAFSVAQSTVPGLQAALAAGRAPPSDDLFELDRVQSALAEAAEALGLDPDRATLAELEARLSTWERAIALRGALERLARASGPAVAAGPLAVVAADATRLGAAASWSPEDEVHVLALSLLVELADVAAGDGDDERILVLDAELRSRLGPAATPVVLAAARGRLVLPAHPSAPSDTEGHRPQVSGRPPGASPPARPDGRRTSGAAPLVETAPLTGTGQSLTETGESLVSRATVAASPPATHRAVAAPAVPAPQAAAKTVAARPQEQELPEGYERRWLILGVLCFSLLVIVLDNTILNVALPTLVRKLGATTSQLQWMVDAYTLVFAGLLLTMGNLGDRYGRRYALAAGLVIFGIGSALSAFAGSANVLIVTRAIMGIGGALIMPSTLSILTNVFPAHERGRAIGIWAGVSGSGIALGPVIGGWLLVHFWWGSIFLVNVPIVVFALIVGRLIIPNSRDPDAPPLDPVGAGLSIVGLMTLVYGIIEAPAKGWTSGQIVASLGIAVVVLCAFVVWELRSDHPMLNVHFFSNPRFTAANVSITLTFFAMFGSLFFLTQYLQFVLGYSALQAGLRVAPMALVMMVIAPTAGRFVETLGNKAMVAVGMAVGAGGLFLLSTTTTSSGYSHLLAGLVILAIGLSFAMVPATESIMGSLPPAKAGVGSAMNDTTRQIGGALGVAILGSIMSSSYSSSIIRSLRWLPGPLMAAAKSGVGAAIVVGTQIGGPAGQAIIATAKSAFIHAMDRGLEVGAAIALVGALVAALWLPNRPQPASAMPATGGTDRDVRPTGELAEAEASS
jgi:EmrB/QacA subfamily drug resistance transporter